MSESDPQTAKAETDRLCCLDKAETSSLNIRIERGRKNASESFACKQIGELPDIPIELAKYLPTSGTAAVSDFQISEV